MSLKILCLHGYRQNKDKFKVQTGALRKALKNKAEFHFMSAPHRVPDNQKKVEDKDEDQRGWWFSSTDSFSAKEKTDTCFGFDESIKLIEEEFTKEGPFDGILGFSQGAALVALICCLKEKQRFQHNFKFAILIAGFKSLSKQHLALYEECVNIPSLHVFGNTDQIINDSLSSELLKVFKEPVCLNHDGGHFVPCGAGLKKTYIEFIELRIKSKECEVEHSV